MKIIVLLSGFIIISFCGCNYHCKTENEKIVVFEFFCFSKGDSYKIILDSGKFIWDSPEFKNDFVTNYRNRRFIIKKYYTTSDSIKVYLSFKNIRDTTFFIDSKKVSTCYLNIDLEDDFHVNYLYRDSLNIVGYD